MPNLIAHSERSCKTFVRDFRRGGARYRYYKMTMKLRIAELRKERGLTVEALAEKANMSKSYLSEVSTGRKQINARILDNLARALGVSVFSLIDADSVDAEIMAHIERLRSMSADDRAAIIAIAEKITVQP